VSELLKSIDQAFQASFPDDVWVDGEISALKAVPLHPGEPRGPRHIFFDLVDPTTTITPGSGRSVLPVKLFDSQRTRVNALLRRYGTAGIKMTDGVRVRIAGRLQFYPARSQVELRMNLLDPAYTLALLATERDRVLKTLSDEGLLEANGRLCLPPVPLSVGLITSAGSAAAADFLHELQASGIAWNVVLAPARVQGSDAEQGLISALALLEARSVEVIAMVRGGGARTELATFDAESLGRAIANCRVPVLTGIGHEVDDSVADRVAHGSYKTPTACAAALVGRVRSFIDESEVNWAAVARAARSACDSAGAQVEQAAGAVGMRSRSYATHRRSALLNDQRRLVLSARRTTSTTEHRMADLAARVRALDPSAAMARGWTITRSVDGSIVRSMNDLRTGDQMVTVFHDGEVVSVVGETSA